jgi:hypothetical protein
MAGARRTARTTPPYTIHLLIIITQDQLATGQPTVGMVTLIPRADRVPVAVPLRAGVPVLAAVKLIRRVVAAADLLHVRSSRE